MVLSSPLIRPCMHTHSCTSQAASHCGLQEKLLRLCVSLVFIIFAVFDDAPRILALCNACMHFATCPQVQAQVPATFMHTKQHMLQADVIADHANGVGSVTVAGQTRQVNSDILLTRQSTHHGSYLHQTHIRHDSIGSTALVHSPSSGHWGNRSHSTNMPMLSQGKMRQLGKYKDRLCLSQQLMIVLLCSVDGVMSGWGSRLGRKGGGRGLMLPNRTRSWAVACLPCQRSAGT